MIAVDLEIRLDAEFGTVDYAYLERIIHEALTYAHMPVVDVAIDATRVIDAPIPEYLPAEGTYAAPYTRPPGAQPLPGRY